MSEVIEFPQVKRLLWVMSELRDPERGCPWDKQQSFETIVPFTIEEAYEVADAIEQGDMNEIKDELGDLLFQVVFYAQLGKEQNEFDFEAIAKTVCDKLIRRHPHVFSGVEITDHEQLENSWNDIKRIERQQKGQDTDNSILANIPKGMTPLLKANKLQKRCAKVGFDWQTLMPVVSKVKEEIDEVLQEVETETPNQDAIEEEIGDLLFAVVNLSRHLNVDPDKALRQGNRKFEKRFRKVEAHLSAKELSLNDVSLEEMEVIWQQVKEEGL